MTNANSYLKPNKALLAAVGSLAARSQHAGLQHHRPVGGAFPMPDDRHPPAGAAARPRAGTHEVRAGVGDPRAGAVMAVGAAHEEAMPVATARIGESLRRNT